MSTTEITHVELYPVDSERLWGFFIDFPTPGSKREVYDFELAGWVLGKHSPVLGIEVCASDGSVRKIPVTLPRPDISRHYPHVPLPKDVGFWSPISVIGLPEEFELVVEAVLEDREHVPLGRIGGRHRSIQSHFEPSIRPLLVTSLGRTGTTWLMRLLAEHPNIVAYRAYPYEMRAGRYWLQVMGALTEPASQAQSSSRITTTNMQWWVAHPPFSRTARSADPRLQDWFGRRFVEQAAAMCQQSLDLCYREVAANQNQLTPVYFAEKHLPDEVPGIVWELYPRAREIFLVRDFRDMLCSIRAFNKKRRSLGFGRDMAASEQEYVVNLGKEALRLLKSWKARNARACLVRYEDLILQPGKTLKHVLQYLELESEDSWVNEMIRTASLDTPQLQEHRTTASVHESVGRWRSDLDTQAQRMCEDAFGTSLSAFGYPPEGY